PSRHVAIPASLPILECMTSGPSPGGEGNKGSAAVVTGEYPVRKCRTSLLGSTWQPLKDTRELCWPATALARPLFAPTRLKNRTRGSSGSSTLPEEFGP